MLAESQFSEYAVAVEGMSAVQFQNFLGKIYLLVTDAARKHFFLVRLAFESDLSPFRIDLDP